MSLLSGGQVVGVDIGHSSVKVVGLEVGRKPHFIGCKEITMDPKYLQKEGFNNPALIGQALREAMRTAAPKALHSSIAYSAVSESLVFRKIIEMPVIEDKAELRSSIILEIGQYLPESAAVMEVDYQILGMIPETTNQQIMVVAVNRKIIQDYLAVFASAKLDIKAIDTKPAAVGRAIVAPQEKEAIILVDIGSEITTLSIYDQQIIRVTGSLNMGGNIIRDPETGEVDEDKRNEKIKRLVGGVSDELEHVIKFYENRTVSPQKIKGVRLSGGGSMIAGVSDGLAKQVDLQVDAAEAIVSLPPFCDRRFLGALGCALYPLYEQLS